MLAVRFVALAALVMWLGVTLVVLGNELFGEFARRFHAIAAACGAVVFVSLFVMKFVGPPPAAFVVRAGIVFVMLSLAVYSFWSGAPSITVLALNAILGLALLYWYSNE